MNRLQDGNLRRPPVNDFHESFCLNKEENWNRGQDESQTCQTAAS